MSSEKQYNHIENKIIEAANGTDYSFNEESWKKMELLLDQKKDKRRPFFWIFASALLGILIIGGTYIYQKSDKINKSVIAEKQTGNTVNEKSSQTDLNGKNDLTTKDKPAFPDKNIKTADKPASPATATTKNVNGLSTIAVNNKSKIKAYNTKGKDQPVSYEPDKAQKPRTKNAVPARKDKKYGAKEKYNADNKNVYKTDSKMKLKITSPGIETDPDNLENKTDLNNETYLADINKKQSDTGKMDLTKLKDADKPDTMIKKTTTVTKSENKKGNSFSGLYLLGVLGAETNSTKFMSFANSTIVPRYGFSIGYQINKRLSVQTGFYASSKKYIAGPDDYNAKPGTYLSRVNILEVDADCLVYDVPVTVQYNWLNKPATSYYAAVGLSSYIMKKEEYYYTIERYNAVYSYPYVYTKNTHLFTSLHMSVGIEKRIKGKFYLQAAPVINIPLSGNGEGDVKLFSTSLNIGIKYFPFKK